MLSRHAEAGFTLVEVMVTVFVVAIGVLAAAGLQAISKKAAFDALQRTTATVLAQDMLERIRSNSLQISRYAGREISAAPTTAVSCGSGTACTASDLVDYDLARWWQSLDGAAEKIVAGTDSGGAAVSANAGGLRSPVGCIRQNGNIVEVVIAWRGMTTITQAADGSPDDPTSDLCGDGNPDYEKSGSSSFRRVLRLQAHIRT